MKNKSIIGNSEMLCCVDFPGCDIAAKGFAVSNHVYVPISLRLALDCTGAKRGHAIGNTVLVKTILMRISLNAYKATFIPTFLSLLEYRNTP